MTSFQFKNSWVKFFDFWRFENFLRKPRCLKKNQIFEKRFLNCLRKHFCLANYCLVSPHKFTECNLPNVVPFVVFFVPMILKVVFYNINENDKRPYKLWNEMWITNGFCSKFPEQSILWGALFLKHVSCFCFVLPFYCFLRPTLLFFHCFARREREHVPLHEHVYCTLCMRGASTFGFKFLQINRYVKWSGIWNMFLFLIRWQDFFF